MTERPACPFCEAPDTERVGQWGGQIVMSQWRCRGCGSYFEALRDDFGEACAPAGLEQALGSSAVARDVLKSRH